MNTTTSDAPTRRRRLFPAATAAVLGVGLFLAGGVGLAPVPGSRAPAPVGLHESGTAPGSLSADITRLQKHLRDTPQDAVALASLGLAYVQQAKIIVDPTYYPKAEAVLTESLKLDSKDNFTAMGAMAALEAARHNFAAALGWSQQAIAVSPESPTLYGTLADAYTQLGRYPEAFRAVQRMVDLRPDTPSLSRTSYTWELRGDIDAATENMKRALDDAGSPADRAFALQCLSQLAFGNGDPRTALTRADDGLLAAPSSAALLASKARAEAALGKVDAALADYTRTVARVPQPEYVVELGELFQSLGRAEEADQQYRIFRSEEKLFTDNGVALDSDATLFEADHGDPGRALTLAEQGLRIRPFLEMHDAYAWALHVNGRDGEALEQSQQATALGTRNALFHYHRGMIEKALGRTDAARDELEQALRINPAFSPLQAPSARAALLEARS